jgi:hypothetical protein
MSKTMPNLGLSDASRNTFRAPDPEPGTRKGMVDSGEESTGRRRSQLAELVSSHLRSNGLRQIDFCRQQGFDQGLLSKILSSVVNTLNVETAIKLAEGMNLPPRVVFDAIGKSDVHEMLVRVYSGNLPS